MPKGKTNFTKQDYERLRDLITQREKADSTRQKSIRAKIRKLGLYWSEVASGSDYTVENFERLFTQGILKISDGKKEEVDTNNEIYNPIEEKQDEISDSLMSIDDEEKDIEKELINGNFLPLNELESGNKIPKKPGLYCIKIKEGIIIPKEFGQIRKDGIIYIGIASTSLFERLWEQELNHKKAATFFRSIGAMLGFLPPKGSLSGKETRNYKFDNHDTEEIRQWMGQSLLVNFVTIKIPKEKLEKIEKKLIEKFCPLVNLDHNPKKSQALKNAREKCVKWARMS